MTWYLTGFLWLLQLCFWGLGLSWLVTPRRWRRFWLAFCPVLGLAFQSAVVWTAVHTALPGSDSYAVAAQLLPLGVLVLAVARNGGLVGSWQLFAMVRHWWAIVLIMTLSLSAQIVPFTKPPALLTSTTLGSCDPADYAAGARVFKEFSSRDRSGFVGEKEVVQVLGVDNFFDFWLRLNHFTPSALIAFEASVLGRQPYELISLLGAVLLALNLPGVFWLARSGFRFNRVAAILVTLIYGFSPLLFYAVYQTALGQLLAAPAVSLLTWVGIRAYHGRDSRRRYAAYSGLLLGCNWLILGSYNFFILFAYVPLATYIGGYTLWSRDWGKAGRWCFFAGLNLLVCALLFPGRVLSLADRFLLFNATPFGWRIPALVPSSWYGVFADVKLQPAVSAGAFLLAAACLLSLAYVVIGPLRRRPRICALAASCSVPIFIGYAILLAKETRTHDNSSYDAYKLFCVFYPGILTSLCLWMSTLRRRVSGMVAWSGALATALVCCNLAGVWKFNAAIRQSTSTVDQKLAQIAAIEQMPEVPSINLCLKDYWQRLWANYFLLHKRQYFPVATYEGRRITSLRGLWDLHESMMLVQPFDSRDSVELNSRYFLVRHGCRDRVRTALASGWFATERDKTQSWNWSQGGARILLNNPHPYALDSSVDLVLRSLENRHVTVWLGPTRLWENVVGTSLVTAKDLHVPLATGANFLRLESREPATPPNAGEPRGLAFALFHMEVHLLTPPPASLPLP